LIWGKGEGEFEWIRR